MILDHTMTNQHMRMMNDKQLTETLSMGVRSRNRRGQQFKSLSFFQVSASIQCRASKVLIFDMVDTQTAG